MDLLSNEQTIILASECVRHCNYNPWMYRNYKHIIRASSVNYIMDFINKQKKHIKH